MVTPSTAAVRQATDGDDLVGMLRQMLRIRCFDTAVPELFKEGLIHGSSHMAVGQEAVAVGACAALRPHDYVTSTHRGHGHCIAKGADPQRMMAEILGKETGYCRGRGGSMHIADFSIGMLGANGVVGGGIALATGAALSIQLRGEERVALCFFGDGAINQGALAESANIAAIWRLPVVYLCENNQYAMSARASQVNAVSDLAHRAEGLGLPGVSVDGMDVLAVREVVAEAVARARRGGGPSLVVAECYRFAGHYTADNQVYRTREEGEPWRARDPILLLRRHLIATGLLDDERADALAAEMEREIEAAVRFAKESPEPPPASGLDDVYA